MDIVSDSANSRIHTHCGSISDAAATPQHHLALFALQVTPKVIVNMTKKPPRLTTIKSDGLSDLEPRV